MNPTRRLAGLAALLGVGFFDTAAFAQAASSLSDGRSFTEAGGAALYANVCAACHQPDAKGAVGAATYPALAGNPKLASADYMLSAMLYGLRSMPPVGRMMSDAQVADVVNYVRTHFANHYDDAVSAAESPLRGRLPNRRRDAFAFAERRIYKDVFVRPALGDLP